MPTKYYLDWKEVKENWSVTDYIWIDVAILIGDVVGDIISGDYRLTLDDIDPMETLKRKLKEANVDQKKAEKFLEVIVNVKGETKKIKKSVSKPEKITIKDIQKVLNKYGHKHIKVEAKIKDQK